MAGLDTRIPLAFQSPQIQTPNQNKLQSLAIQGQQQELDQRGRALGEQNALAALMQRPDTFDARGGINPAILPEVGRVAPGQVLGFSKQIQGQQKAISDAQKAQLEQASKQLGLVGQLLGGVTDENSYQAARAQAQQLGLPVANAPERYDPNWVQQQLQQTQTYQQKMDNYYKQQGIDIKRDEMASKLAAPVGAPFEAMSNGKPLLLQRYGDGSLKPVDGFQPKLREGLSITTNPDGTVSVTTGGAKGQKMTEGQSKDLLFGTRAEESDRIINELVSPTGEGEGVNLLAANALGSDGFGGTVRNLLAPENVQKYNQAKRDFINAVLRKESGAVIAESEFANAEQQYFPQPGDSLQVIQQKANNRSLATRGILANVPPGAQDSVRSGGQPQQQRTVTRRGRSADGRPVIQYSDGSIEYAE